LVSQSTVSHVADFAELAAMGANRPMYQTQLWPYQAGWGNVGHANILSSIAAIAQQNCLV